MKSRKHAKTNRRKFRATKSKVYRKSRRNVKKIMRGGAAKPIVKSSELDETLFDRIQIEKTGNKDTLSKFKEERLSKIPTLNITDNSIAHRTILIFASKRKDGDGIINQITDLAKELLNEEASAINKTVTVDVM